MKYIKGFDTLRAISIIFVLTTHLGLIQLLPEEHFYRARLFNLFSGGIGVRIFFSISGYLITTILLREYKTNGFINFKNFFARRFIRLLPPLIVFYSAIVILMGLDYLKPSAMAVLFSVFYLYNFVPNTYYTGELGHTWSLALEEQFYLIWPFAIHFLFKRKLLNAFIFTLLGLSAFALFEYKNHDFLRYFKAARWFIPAVTPVLIGSYFAILNYKRDGLLKSSNSLLVLSVALVLYLSPLYLPTYFLRTSIFFQSTGISLLLVWIVNHQSSIVTKILDNKPLTYIGKISYGLYVYQGLFLRTGPGGTLWIQQFPQNIILTVCAAIISYHFLEKPILKLKKRFSN